MQKFKQNSIAFKKPGILSENLIQYFLSDSSIFFAATSHTFPTYQSLQKDVWDFFLFCLDLELFSKIKKDLVSTQSFLTLL